MLLPDGSRGGHDGGRSGEPGDTSALVVAGYEVDIDALHDVGNTVLGIADRMATLGEQRSMHHADRFGPVLSGPARRWSDRFSYLLAGLAAEVEHAGHELRGSAEAYREADLAVADRARSITAALDRANASPGASG
jgi:hypothetical protein